MHPQNFMIFGTYKLHNAENETMLSLCRYVNSYSPEDATNITILSICIIAVLLSLNFYRAMHFSAKRGIAIACRLSVRLSVCLSVCNVGELLSHRLEFFENNFTVS